MGLEDKIWSAMRECSDLPNIGSIYTQMVGNYFADALNMLDMDLNAYIDGEGACAELFIDDKHIDSVAVFKDALKEAEDLHNELDEA